MSLAALTYVSLSCAYPFFGFVIVAISCLFDAHYLVEMLPLLCLQG